MDDYLDAFHGAYLTGAENYSEWKQRNVFLDRMRDGDDAATDKKVFFLLKRTVSPLVREQVNAIQGECLNDPDAANEILETPLKWLRSTLERLYGNVSQDPVADNLSFLRRRYKKDDNPQTYVAAKITAYKRFMRSSFPDVTNEKGNALLLAALIDGLPKDIAVRVTSTTVDDFESELTRLVKIYQPKIHEHKTQKNSARPQCNFCGYMGHLEKDCYKKSAKQANPRTLSRPIAPSVSRPAPGMGYSTPRAQSNPQGRIATPSTPYKPPATRKSEQKKGNIFLLPYDDPPSIPLNLSVGGRNLTIDAIIDTGAGVSCINEELCETLSAPLATANRPPIRTATGEHAQVVGMTTLRATSHGARLNIDADIKFHVLKDLNVPLILGWADLKHWNIGQLFPSAHSKLQCSIEA